MKSLSLTLSQIRDGADPRFSCECADLGLRFDAPTPHGALVGFQAEHGPRLAAWAVTKPAAVPAVPATPAAPKP